MQSPSSTNTLAHKSFAKPDESRNAPNAVVDIVYLPHHKVSRATAQPGWKWSTDIKPIAKTETCQVPHMGYMLSGSIAIAFGDKVEVIHAGETYSIEPGHDAWVVGDKEAVMLDFAPQTAEAWAKQAHEHK